MGLWIFLLLGGIIATITDNGPKTDMCDLYNVKTGEHKIVKCSELDENKKSRKK